MSDIFENGVVKWYSLAKGYGFIIRASTGEDVFIHYSAMADDEAGPFLEGQDVVFEVAQGPKGLQGRKVSRR